MFMVILVGAEIDLFVPSFPELQKVFALTPFMVELTLGVNLGAHCLVCPLVGTLGDRYGRKPVIMIGLSIFIVGSIFCTFASSYWQVLLGRFLQGLGISGPAVLAYLVIADMYSTEQQQRILGTLNGIMTLAMALAPVLGSYISLYFHWQGNFALLLLLGTLCLALTILFIPPGQPNAQLSLNIKAYLAVLRSAKANYYILSINFLILGYWVFIAVAPILYMEDLGVSLRTFGFYQGAIAGVFSIVSFSSGYFIKRFGARACLNFGLGMMVVFLGANLLMLGLGVKNPLIITASMQLLAVGSLFPLNILWPLAFESVPNAKGRIAAILVSTRLVAIAIIVQMIGYFYNHTFQPIGIALTLIIVGAFFSCYKLFQLETIFTAPKDA